MKRLLLFLFLIMSLTACGQAEQPEKPQGKPQITPLIKKTHYDEEGNMWTWEDNICWTRMGNTVRVAGSGTLEKVHMRTVKSFWDDEVTKVIIEDGITGIGKKCFYKWYNLEEIELPDSVTFIDDDAFFYCLRLREVDIPSRVTFIGNRAFAYSYCLTRVKIKGELTEIGEEAFYECQRLRSVKMEKGVGVIRKEAFSYCVSLKKMGLKKGTFSIKRETFYNCRDLKEIILPEGIKQIGKYAFSGCHSLRKLTLPESLEKYEKSAIGYCTGISKIVNKSPYDWKLPRKSMMEGEWQSDGKDIGNVIPAGKTIEIEPQVYSITYDLDGGTAKEKMPTTYQHSKGLKLPDSLTKKGYILGGWYENGLEGEVKKKNQIAPGEMGNKKLTAIWVKYDVKNIGGNRIKVVCDLEEKWEDEGLYCIVRCSEYKDLSYSTYKDDNSFLQRPKGEVVFDELESKKRYYIKYAIYAGIDWEDMDDMDDSDYYDVDHDWQGKRSIVVE